MKSAEQPAGQQTGSRIMRMVVRVVCILLVVTAAVALLTTLLFPTLRIYGTSMAPALNDGDVVVTFRPTEYHAGDVIAFYHNNELMVKRVICGPGDWFNMREDGTVMVNGTELDEPYVANKAFGSCNITLPYQVPEGQYFVMGDQRNMSIDSRVTQMGCVTGNRIVGKVALRVWPLNAMGSVTQ